MSAQCGRVAGYVSGCRCDPCTEASSRWHRARQLRILEGTWNTFVDAGPVQAHVSMLREAGMTLPQIADAAGVRLNTVIGIAQAKHSRVRPSNEAAILAVKVQAPVSPYVDAFATQRRIQALVAMGWSSTALGARLGVSRHGVAALLTRPRVLKTSAARIARLYGELAMKPGPSEIARSRSRARGWVTAMAWEDIDDPADRPHDGSEGERAESAGDGVVLALQGVVADLTPEERREVVATLAAQGLSDAVIGRRTGVSSQTIIRDRRRLGLIPRAVSDATSRRAA